MNNFAENMRMQDKETRYFIKLAYTGTNYHGWQRQPEAVTVQEVLENALSKVLRDKIIVVGAGRTDTGVHARVYYAHFDCLYKSESLQNMQLVHKLNSMLPSDVAVYEIKTVRPDAHARFSALSRTYMYYICTRKDPFWAEYAWLFTRKLDIEAIEEASIQLLNHNDFSSFARSNTQVKTNICRVYEASWKQENHLLIFKISADRFLRNMVRAIVGTLIDVGLRKISPEEFNRIILSCDRRNAGYSAPACGLYLTEIKYPENILK